MRAATRHAGPAGCCLTPPDRTLSELAVLSEVERELVVERWNDTAVDIGEGTLNVLFEEQAARRPEQTAVIFEDHRLTYGRLNEHANRLAAHLSDCTGVRRGDLVGVLLDRGIDFAVALIAIAWTRSFIKSPSAALTARWRWRRVMPAKHSASISTVKCDSPLPS
jgi:non-ribosomal peptide synthetase component F